MNAEQLEQEALKLPLEERAKLAGRLISSLDAEDDSILEEEWRAAWAEEAERRDAELTADPSRGIPAEEVFRRIRARLK